MRTPIWVGPVVGTTVTAAARGRRKPSGSESCSIDRPGPGSLIAGTEPAAFGAERPLVPGDVVSPSGLGRRDRPVDGCPRAPGAARPHGVPPRAGD
jgi:hypothetical protein